MFDGKWTMMLVGQGTNAFSTMHDVSVIHLSMESCSTVGMSHLLGDRVSLSARVALRSGRG